MICVRETIRCISAEDPPSSSLFFKNKNGRESRRKEVECGWASLVLLVGFEKTQRAGWIACLRHWRVETGVCSPFVLDDFFKVKLKKNTTWTAGFEPARAKPT